MDQTGQAEALRIAVSRSGAVLATRACMARSFLSRMVGLLGHDHLDPGQALIIESCRSIHTWGMRFPIDAVFVDRDWRVVALQQGLRPGQITPWYWGASRVIEVPNGAVSEAKLGVGDQLVVEAI